MGVDRWWEAQTRPSQSPAPPPSADLPRSGRLVHINAKYPVLFDPARVSTVRIEPDGEGGAIVIVHTLDGYAFAITPAATQTALGLFERIADLVG